MKTTRDYQKEELEVLFEFNRVCRKLGLQYFLTAGTLLGAIRHKGFIPWDDDIDVAMPRREFERFRKEGVPLLKEGYFFQDYHSEPNFPYYFAKIRKQGTSVEEPILRSIPMEQGVYIDIFPLDCCPDSAKTAQLLFKGIELINCAVLARVSSEFSCGYRKWKMRSLWYILKHLPNQALFFLREVLRRGMGRLASGKCLCTVGGHHGYPRETYCAEWFQAVVPVEFESEVLPAPVGWEEILKNMYGDYMTPPKEECRQGHFQK